MSSETQMPKEYVRALIALSKLSDAQFQELREKVSSVEASKSLPLMVQEMSFGESKLRGIDFSDILGMLVSMHGTRQMSEVEPEIVVAALQFGIDHTDALKEIPAKARESVKSRISELMNASSPALVNMARVWDVANDHERSYSTSRILTDLRPVFFDDPHKSPLGLVVMHSLKLSYQEDFNAHEFFLTLDSDELEELSDVVQRARDKENTLKAILKEKEWRLLQ